jgi:serine/threonine-protein kinase HipA
MSRIEVNYQERKVGVLAEARGGVFFEYDPEFIAAGHELSPLLLPLGPGVRARDNVPGMRLPGLFEDSLPDLWGRRVMAEWFRRHGVAEHAVTPLMMLAYVGNRAMGALTYQPDSYIEPSEQVLNLGALFDAAARAEASGPIDLKLLAEVGSPAGGARPKALIGLPKGGAEGEPLAGAGELPSDYEAWMIKFDTTRDAAAGPMEEAYARLAAAAGIDLPATRLLTTEHEAGQRRHFAVKRFDRAGTERIHHHTLAGLCQVGGGDLDYSTFLRVTRRLTKDEREVWRAFRRAAFNVLASNRDDHGKNHGFLYRNGEWRLAPAYDLTFTSPAQTPERGMAVLGERARANRSVLHRLAENEGLDRRAAAEVIDEVQAATGRWQEFAEAAAVPSFQTAAVRAVLDQINFDERME